MNDDHENAVPPTTDLSGEAPTVAINTGLLPSMSQHCTRCGHELAVDQRYCVNCGERRGDPRLPFMDGRTTTTTTTTVATAAAVPPPPPSKARFGSGATLIAGVGTLLLALGVGVLIGNAGQKDSGTAAAAAPQVITVQGGGVAATDTTATADAAADKGADKKASDKKAKDSGDDKSATETKAAAAKVIKTESGAAVPQAETPVVKKGAKGSGPGYKDGEFTGDFFGQ